MFWHFCAPLLSFMTCVWMLLPALRVQAYKQPMGIHRARGPNKCCHPCKDPSWNKEKVAVFPERCGGGAVPVSFPPFHCPTTCTLTLNWPWVWATVVLVGMDWRPAHPLQDLINGSLIIDSQQKTNGHPLKLLMNAAVTWNLLLLWGWSLISCVNQVHQAKWWLQQHRSLVSSTWTSTTSVPFLTSTSHRHGGGTVDMAPSGSLREPWLDFLIGSDWISGARHSHKDASYQEEQEGFMPHI